MGRIAWFDALARQRIGDVNGFEAQLLAPPVVQHPSSFCVS